MARIFAPVLDPSRWPDTFVPARLEAEPLRNNRYGLPIPSTPRQTMAAFEAVQRYCEERPMLMARDTLTVRLTKELQLLMQGRPSNDEAVLVARGVARMYLNGF